MSESEGPSETVVALVFPFVGWYDAATSGENVCKTWRRVLLSDGLWRQYIEIELLQCDDEHARRLQNDDSYAPIDGRYCSLFHKLLDKERTFDHGRTLKQAFFACRRLELVMFTHENNGPDALSHNVHGHRRTMRQNKVEQYRGVRAKIDKLQAIFGNDGNDRDDRTVKDEASISSSEERTLQSRGA